MATGSSFIRLFSQDDPVPDMYVAPPLTSNFEAACLEKMPLVDRIANACQSIRVTPDMPICSWNRSGRSCKHITVWTHGFLYTMSRESLEYLIENPDVAEQVCDNAKAFPLLCKSQTPSSLGFFLVTAFKLCIADFSFWKKGSAHDMRKKYFRDTSVWVAPRSYTSTVSRHFPSLELFYSRDFFHTSD